MFSLPKLYAIVDSGFHPELNELVSFCEDLRAAGCELMQYRNKYGTSRQALDQARELRQRLGASVKLIMNDRADLCLAAQFDGVHIGQDDLQPESARRVIGLSRWLGVSTHDPEQVAEADQTSANYVAIGPVFETASKRNPDPIIGLDGVRRARRLTRKPLVAIGGITRANCRKVIEAGADSVAVISDLISQPRKSAEEFLRILG
jgi:thiamine-phosphate pyrophosphorylase